MPKTKTEKIDPIRDEVSELDQRRLESVRLDQEQMLRLGMYVAKKDPMITLLLDWAEKRSLDMVRELNGLATNPAIPDRVIMIGIGNSRLNKEIQNLLRTAELKFKAEEARRKSADKGSK